MSLFKNNNYYVTYGWMTNVLSLTKTELSVFAIIYGFSQTYGNKFTGSCQYLADAVNCCKSSIYTILEELQRKKYIIKYKVANKDGVFIQYGCNLKYIEQLISEYENTEQNCTEMIQITEISSDEPVQKLDESFQKLDKSVQKLDESFQKLDEPVQKLDKSVQKLEHIIYNNIDNKIDNNKDINVSNSCSRTFSQNFSLKNKTNTKSTKLNFSTLSENINLQQDQTEERGGQNTVSVSELIGEKLCDIDNRQAQQNRLLKQHKKQNELTLEEKQNLRIKKARMKEAKELTNDKMLLDALDNFVESYQFTHNKLSKQAWKIILDELFSYQEPNEQLVKYINHSIASGYRKIYKCNNFKSTDFDNTRGRKVEKALHEMTTEELQQFDSTLARDENGNLIVF